MEALESRGQPLVDIASDRKRNAQEIVSTVHNFTYSMNTMYFSVPLKGALCAHVRVPICKYSVVFFKVNSIIQCSSTMNIKVIIEY